MECLTWETGRRKASHMSDPGEGRVQPRLASLLCSEKSPGASGKKKASRLEERCEAGRERLLLCSTFLPPPLAPVRRPVFQIGPEIASGRGTLSGSYITRRVGEPDPKSVGLGIVCHPHRGTYRALRLAKTASGCSSATCSRRREGPSGTRAPCSQPRTVPRLTLSA